jgi:CheY-like chemotaxis protein
MASSPARDQGEGPDPGLALVAHRSGLIRAWVRILLEQRGFRVEEAPHGVRALERAALGGPPSFYFLERTLPPRGASWVLDRIVSLGIAKPGAVVYLSPSERLGEDPPTIGVPLTRQSLDLVLATPAL